MLRDIVVSCIIVGICVEIHTAGLVVLAERVLDRRSTLQRLGAWAHGAVMLAVFAAVIILHMIETAIWAGFYLWWDLFHDFETAWYFSLTSYTTIGFGDVTLPERWRMLGGVEGFSGVLLCGISTAFIFVILNAMVNDRVAQAIEDRSTEEET